MLAATWYELLQQYPVIAVLLSPLDFFNRPETRVFWPFLLSSVFVALLVQKLKPEWVSLTLWQSFKHHSAKLDVLVWFSNQWLRLLVFLPLFFSQLAVSLWLVRNLYALFDGRPDWQINTYLLFSLFTLVSFLADDFSRFYLHRFLHKNKWLWQFHQLHHSAKVLTPFTLYRIHPVEMLLYMLRSVLVLGLCAGVFSYCFKGQISGWHILGVNLFGFVFNAALANLRHSHIRLGFGFFERFFISPAQHQIHHQDNKVDFNSNYGSCLAIWDRGFGSWQASKNNKPTSVGLNNIEHKNLLQAWLMPFKHCWRLINNKKRA